MGGEECGDDCLEELFGLFWVDLSKDTGVDFGVSGIVLGLVAGFLSRWSGVLSGVLSCDVFSVFPLVVEQLWGY